MRLMSRPAGLMVLLFAAAAFAAPATQPAAPVYDIPKLEKIQIDGSAADWGDDGLRINALTSLDPAKPASDDFYANVRLGWNDRGLLVLLEVHDSTPHDAPDANTLNAGDSVELFISQSVGGAVHTQTVISPGVEKQPSPRWTVSFRAPGQKIASTQPGEGSAAPEIARVKTDFGYVMEVLLPWSQIALSPADGQEIGLQFWLNDVAGAARHLYWYPGQYPMTLTEQMQRVRLTKSPSAPVNLAIVGDYDRLRRARVGVVGDETRAGAKVEVRNASSPDAAPLASAVLVRAVPADAVSPASEPSTGDAGRVIRPQALLQLPLPPVGQPFPPLAVYVDGQFAGNVMLPDLDGTRRRALLGEKLIVRNFVFDGPGFPAPEFTRPSEVEDDIGPYHLAATYYDNAFHRVKKAEQPGRYGLVAEVKNAAGEIVDRRYATLYRVPKKITWRTVDLKGAFTLPPEAGIDPAVADDQRDVVERSVQGMFSHALEDNGELGRLMAGLAELKPQQTGPDYVSIDRQDDQWWHDLKKSIGQLTPYKYIEHLPPGYGTDPGKRWPLILFLHGSGERGDDFTVLRSQGLPLYLTQHEAFPFVVISPQCPKENSWSPALLADLLDEVTTKYAIDPDRVYLTGLSMGGFGAWALAAKMPDRFAAVAPIAGGGDTMDAARLKGLPMWVFHGDADPVVPIIFDQRSVAALQAVGGDVKFTVYPGVDHDSWTQTYENPALYEWLLSRQRAAKH